jgi:hypothetical protein
VSPYRHPVHIFRKSPEQRPEADRYITNLKTQGLLETSTSLSTIFWQHAVCVPVDAVLLFSTVTMVVGTQILRVNIVATPTIYTVKLGFSLNSLLVVSLFLAITCYVYKVINPRYRDISCIFF